MKVDTTYCPAESACTGDTPIQVQVAKSAEVTKTNTLHQFDTVGIIGLPSPVGKLPIVFYVRDTATTGHRGIIYYDDRDTVCWMFPESKHAEWCKQPYDIKYDKVEPFDNGVESGFKRNHGILQLWVSVLRKWYNGQVIYRPHLKIQGCGVTHDGYPRYPSNYPSDYLSRYPSKKKVTPVKNKINHSCGCRKGL